MTLELNTPGFFVFSAKATRAGQRQTDKRAESRMESLLLDEKVAGRGRPCDVVDHKIVFV